MHAPAVAGSDANITHCTGLVYYIISLGYRTTQFPKTANSQISIYILERRFGRPRLRVTKSSDGSCTVTVNTRKTKIVRNTRRVVHASIIPEYGVNAPESIMRSRFRVIPRRRYRSECKSSSRSLILYLEVRSI